MFKKRSRKGVIKEAEQEVDQLSENNYSPALKMNPKKRKLEDHANINEIQEIEDIEDLKTNPLLEDSNMDMYHNDDQTAFFEDTVVVSVKPEKKYLELKDEYNSFIDVDDELDLMVLKRQGIAVQEKQIETVNLDHVIDHLESLENRLQTDIMYLNISVSQLENEFDSQKSKNVNLTFTDEQFINAQKMAAQLNILIPQKIETNYLVQLVNELTHHKIKSKMNNVLLKLKSFLNPSEFNVFETNFELPVPSNKYFYHFAFAKKQFEEMPLIFDKSYRQVWEYLFTIEYCYSLLFLNLTDIGSLYSMSNADISWIPSHLKESTNLLFLFEPFPCSYFLDFMSMILICVNYSQLEPNLDDFIDDFFIFPGEWFKDEYYFTIEEIMGKLDSGYYSNSILSKLKD